MSAHEASDPAAGWSSPQLSAQGIDPRGPRFSAGVTSVVLTVTLLLGDTTPALLLLGLVAATFVTGVVSGPAGSLTGTVYRRWVAPLLPTTRDREDPGPPRFAQAVGLTISAAGIALGLIGVPGAVPIAAAVALVASFLNAAFGFCLGCELYLLGRRFLDRG